MLAPWKLKDCLAEGGLGEGKSSDRKALYVLVVLCAAYGIFLCFNIVPALSHMDAAGYWAQGRLLAQTGRTWFVPASNLQYSDVHWLLVDENTGRIASRYPPGLPAAVAAVHLLLGPKATYYLSPLLATLSVLAVGLVMGRIGCSFCMPLAGMVLAVNRDFNEHALMFIAHLPVLCCYVWGLYLLLRWEQEKRGRFALAAGFLLGCIPALRHPDVLLSLSAGVFMLWPRRGWLDQQWKHVFLAILGGSVPLILFALA